MDIPFSVPAELSLEKDVSPAAWVDEHLLLPGGGDEEVLVGDIVPTGFEAYARIPHPADGERRPPEGSIPEQLCVPLVDVLGRHTGTPDRCFFCVWDGFGFWGGGSSSLTLRAWSGWRGRLHERSLRRAARRAARQEHARLATIPRVHIHPHESGRGAFRSYFLFSGRLGSLASFRFEPGSWFQSPNIWWPQDRSWVVVTEIDDSSTYVGGRGTCIDDVMRSPKLEAVRSDPRSRFGVEVDDPET